eukprot:3445498-Ditylum_brightwellii.AAC.1
MERAVTLSMTRMEAIAECQDKNRRMPTIWTHSLCGVVPIGGIERVGVGKVDAAACTAATKSTW